MAEPKWNPETKRMEFPKPEPGKQTVAGNDTYVAIPKSVIAQLAAIARKDGAQTVEATTPQGEQAQNTRLARPYIMAVINDLIAVRSGAESKGK